MSPHSAAVAAIKEKGILTGLRVERQERGQPGEFEHLSDAELNTDPMIGIPSASHRAMTAQA
jgi:hypothetical protein